MVRTDYFAELEAVGSNSGTASPSDSAFHTPRVSMSRRSSRRDTSSRGGSSSPPPLESSSPPPLPSRKNGNQVENGNMDDDIGPLDPRRFTPTLHASLVSEILNLRRELDSKHKFIEDLESSLQSARNEKDEISDKLAQTDKDRRSIKRQFSHLETGTLSALEELAKDRDDVKILNVDLRAKLDEAQVKIKRKEDESDRTHTAWEKEQNAWETEKRAFERRVHITETRLKAVLLELEAAHLAHAQMHEQHISGEEDDNTKDSGLGDESDTASQASPRRNGSHVRTMSNSSRRSFNRYRFSVQSLAAAEGYKPNGISLADELQLDEENEDDFSMCDVESDYHSEQLARRVTLLRHSQLQDDKAKRILGLTDNRRTLQSPIDFEALEAAADLSKPKVEYVDAGVQYEEPPAPVFARNEITAFPEYDEAVIQYAASGPGSTDRDADKHFSKLRATTTTPPLLIDRGQQMSPRPSSPLKSRIMMVSEGSQTLDEPLSPPATPGVSPPSSPKETVSTENVSTQKGQIVKTISTQTDFAEELKMARAHLNSRNRPSPPAPMTIPSIAIIPPASAPSSPTTKEPKLPPGTKSISTQTNFKSAVPVASVSVQTEEIRIDVRRLSKLPPHLHPSSVSSNPGTPELSKTRLGQKIKSSLFADRSILRSSSQMKDEVPSSPPRMPSPTMRSPGDKYESGISSDRAETRRGLRTSILAPPFESDLETDRDDGRSDFSEGDQKLTSYSTPSSGRGMKHHRKIVGTRPSPVPEEKEAEDRSPSPEPLSLQDQGTSAQSVASQRSSMDTVDRGKSSSRAMSIKSTTSKSQSMRRSAIIQSSVGAHLHRSRTPSIVSVGSSYLSNRSGGPPFPVPDRASSRKLFVSRSEGSQSPTPRTAGLFSSRKSRREPIVRKDSLRKVRSATAIQRSNSRGRNRSRSPPLDGLPSPTYPPLPKDNISAPAKVYASQRSGDKRLGNHLTSPTSKPELSRASQGTVVDSIAATMVGEWMFKYVRRRTSFGVPESPHEQMGRPGTDGSVNVTGNGVRHKRWVWLSPYERAIMWSSKQPASNTALMGKSGRKLVIQSVLDVRDDTPLPKNHGISDPFNRSILILTPARALKFTATSRERHYTWLTALSFLAHSPLLAPGLDLLPQPPDSPQGPPPDIPTRSRAHTLKRGPIRDSVRLAKDRRPAKGASRSDTPTASIPEIEFQAAFGPSAPPPIPTMPDVPAAEPPTVPRYAAHGRKRSLTGPRMPPSTFRALGYKEVPSPSFPMSLSSLPSPSVDYSSARTSEASSVSRQGFLDSVGTIRMEAFIEGQNATFGSGGGRRRGNTAYSSDRGSDLKRGGMVLDDFDVNTVFDPFRDFTR